MLELKVSLIVQEAIEYNVTKLRVQSIIAHNLFCLSFTFFFLKKAFHYAVLTGLEIVM